MEPGSNHPMWKCVHFPHRAFPISRHGGNPEVGRHAQKVILDLLEEDAAAWEEELSSKDGEAGAKNDAG
jgi:hypothetical protein